MALLTVCTMNRWCYMKDIVGTLCAMSYPCKLAHQDVMMGLYPVVGGKDSMKEYIVRRLSTLECTRLQGFPDHWVDIGEWIDSKGKKHRDSSSPKYKALGNSIALPFGISF